MEKKTFVNLNNQENVIVLQPNTARKGFRLRVTTGSGTVTARGYKPNVSDPQNRIQIIQANVPATEGTYKFKSGDVISDAVDFDADETPLLAALRQLPGYESAEATGSFADSEPGLEIDNIDVPFGTPKVEIVESTMKRAGVADVQTLTFSDVPNAGFFHLGFKRNVSAPNGTKYLKEDVLGPFSYATTDEGLEAALRYYFRDSALTVEGDFEEGFVITHGKRREIETMLAAPVNSYGGLHVAKSFTLEFDIEPKAGTFKLGYGSHVTDELDFDISAGDLQTAIRALHPRFVDAVVTANGFNFDLTSMKGGSLAIVDNELTGDEDATVNATFSQVGDSEQISIVVDHTAKGSPDIDLTFSTYNSQEADGPELSDSFTTSLDKSESGMQGKLYLSTADEVTVEIIEIF